MTINIIQVLLVPISFIFLYSIFLFLLEITISITISITITCGFHYDYNYDYNFLCNQQTMRISNYGYKNFAGYGYFLCNHIDYMWMKL